MLSFALLVNTFLFTDMRTLATTWLQDDSFYYWQAAWMFKHVGMFTFDGQSATYGFQPLWTLILTILAYLSPDKMSFLRMSLVLAAVIHVLNGFLLFRLSKLWTGGWKAVIAPAIWMINPVLVSKYTSGKENAVFALILLAVLLLSSRILKKDVGLPTHLVLGCLLGLLVLSRVSSLLAVPLVIGLVIALMDGRRRFRLVALGAITVGFILVILPWFVYADIALGTIFPVSGVRKLIGSEAQAVIFLSNTIPPLKMEWLLPLLSQSEQALAALGENLIMPGGGIYLPPSLGFYHLLYFEHAPRMALSITNVGALLPISLLAYAAIAVPAGYVIAVHRRLLSRPRSWPEPLRLYGPLAVLFLFAILNTVVIGLLLPSWSLWGTWYFVPETLAWTVLASMTFVVLINGAKRAVARFRPRRYKISLALVVVGSTVSLGILALDLLLGSSSGIGPRAVAIAVFGLAISLGGLVTGITLARNVDKNSQTQTSSFQEFRLALAYVGLFVVAAMAFQFSVNIDQRLGFSRPFDKEAWAATRWINENIEAGAKVGTWNSGLVGYFADGPVIINLDGLANSSEFVDEVYLNQMLFLNGITSRNRLWEYLQAENIRYLADAEVESAIGAEPIFGFIPVDSYEVLYDGSQSIWWGRDNPTRRFVVVEIRYPSASAGN